MAHNNHLVLFMFLCYRHRMIPSSEAPSPWSPPQELPDHPYRFVPVPRRNGRADGWSSDRQHCFVWALAALPSVAAAARGVGMSARSAYRLRAAPGAEGFAAAWDDALEIGIWKARDTAIQRAIEGHEVAIVRRGRIIGSQRRFDNRLLVHALANGKAEQQGLLFHQRRLGHRRDVREADARLGGPVDWDAPDRALRAAAEERDRLADAEIAASPRTRGPRCLAL